MGYDNAWTRSSNRLHAHRPINYTLHICINTYGRASDWVIDQLVSRFSALICKTTIWESFKTWATRPCIGNVLHTQMCPTPSPNVLHRAPLFAQGPQPSLACLLALQQRFGSPAPQPGMEPISLHLLLIFPLHTIAVNATGNFTCKWVHPSLGPSAVSHFQACDRVTPLNLPTLWYTSWHIWQPSAEPVCSLQTANRHSILHPA